MFSILTLNFSFFVCVLNSNVSVVIEPRVYVFEGPMED